MKLHASLLRAKSWAKAKGAGFHMAGLNKLRLSQQLIITFSVVVLVPLLGVSFIIYSINQTALKKELLKFTEHTAETIYKDFNTEMGWQQEQSRMMASYLLDAFNGVGVNNKRQSFQALFQSGAQGVFRLSQDTAAVALYDQNGHLMGSAAYRNPLPTESELRLPEQLSQQTLQRVDGHENVYEVFNIQHPILSPEKDEQARRQTQSQYYLRVVVPLSVIPNVPQTTQVDGKAVKPAYYLQLKPFQYLENVIRDHQAIYENFYIVDDNGYVIAGPTRFKLNQAEERPRISDEDRRYFKRIEPGVTHELSNQNQIIPQSFLQDAQISAADELDEAEAPPMEKVIVKMPTINWGIIIESPYHVRQKYIKRAHNQSMLLIVASLVLTILLAMIYILGINRNFRQLIKGINALAEGNYFRRIRLITNFFTPYEIVYLTGEFNRMAKRRAEAWETLEMANQKLAKLDELKSNLIDTVSHELRTPLTNIKGYTSRLLRYDDTLDKETRIKSLKIVKQQADRLSRLVDDLLVIPELEKTSLRVFPDQVSLIELIERCVHFSQAKDHRVIQVTLDPIFSDEVMVLADPDRLEQVLLNILDNAVKYSIPDTAIEVIISQAQSIKPGPHQPAGELIEPMVQLMVINASEPISEIVLETLFNKFQRVDDSTVRTTRGSGLGLFITRGLVEAMGGHITLRSDTDKFSVCFTLPFYHGQVHSHELALTL